tara:strand:+ start:18109 stop:19350 length:1242 start_codon:yes stop_codon:yes gene_type:complete
MKLNSNKMNKKKTIILVAAILLVVILGYAFLGGDKDIEIQVKTVPVQKGDVTTLVTATGTIEPITQVDVGTQVSGTIEKVYVDYNSIVKEGQLIAELDKTTLKSTLAQAQAAYNSAVTQKEYLETIYKRQKQLFDNKVISQSDYEDALYDYNTAKQTVVERQSALQIAKTNLGYANIYSPIDGIVLSRDVDEGQTVAASYSTPTLFTIAQDLEQMQVEADVDEADIGGVKEGQRVTFTVDAFQGETFEGTVTQVRLDYTETSNVITYTVVVKADNPELKLKPGLTATISIYTLELKDVLVTEAKAVNFKPDMATLKMYEEQLDIANNETKPPMPPAEDQDNTTTVWVKNPDGSIVPKSVKIGASDGVHLQILEGVELNDELVYSLEASSPLSSGSTGAGDSPFMPKPPGSNKK